MYGEGESVSLTSRYAGQAEEMESEHDLDSVGRKSREQRWPLSQRDGCRCV